MSNQFSPNVLGVTIDPRTAFPDQYQSIVGLKQQISTLSEQVRAAEANAVAATKVVKEIGALNKGNTSFRGRNAPSVYAAANNTHGYVARGDFAINGFPFRVTNVNSFNAVLAQMKEKKTEVTDTLRGARNVGARVRELQGELKKLDDQLKTQTAKLRKNVSNATARASKEQRRNTRRVTGPSYAVAPGTGESLTSLNTALNPQGAPAPKKGLFSRMFGRKTRRNNRK